MNPCKDLCYQRYGKQYSKECDKECDFAKSVKQSKQNDTRTDEERGSAYAYCEDCRLVEVCKYYPYDGCDFKEVAKVGKWERHYTRPNVYADLFWHCSNCGYKNNNKYAHLYHKYCPHCGARMEVEREKED